MDPPALWCTTVSLSVSSLIIYSKGFGKAELVMNQVANLSTSWIDSPSVISYAQQYPDELLTPILLAGENIGPQFLSGFYCPNYQTCYFGIRIFQGKDHELRTEGYWESNEVKLVWSANGDCPVKVNTTLQLKEIGDFILADTDGTLVWSAKTGGKSVSGLNLAETGNVVLFNRNKAAVWQSFDHPTDCLLPGQILFQGRKLTPIISTSNSSYGLYTVDPQPNGLFADTRSSSPQLYYGSELVRNPYVPPMNGSMSIVPAAATQFMKLDPDRHLRVYEWEASSAISWDMVADLLTPFITECGYPMECGSCGVCPNTDQCCCPDDINNEAQFFKRMDYRQPQLGCPLVLPTSCNTKNRLLQS